MSNRVAPISAFDFADPASYNFQVDAGSIAAGIASNPGTAGGYSLSPTEEYVHPIGFQVRASTNDAGAFAVPLVSGLLPGLAGLLP